MYHLDEYNEEDSKEFGTLVTELNKTGDMNTFLNKLTDLYPYYASNLSDGNYINIKYPLQGFEVTFGTTNNNGITLYSNFKGYITEDLTIDDVKTKKIIPANVYTNLETNLVYNVECNRIDEDLYNRNPYSQAYFIQTEEYTVSRNGENYNFYSRDGGKIDSSLIIKNLTSMINYGENEFVYGVSNDGIYIYNAETLELIKIVEGNGDFNIQSINNRTIYYDNTSVNF